MSVVLKRGLLRCILILFLFGSISPAAAAEQIVSTVGPAFTSKAGGNGDSGLSIISEDGRYILFASTADNLTQTNNNHFVLPCQFNVFLRDTLADVTTLVSINQTGTGGGNGDSFPTGLSTNGQFALFESSASDLVANDTNNASDVFLHDVINGTTTLISVSTAGGSASDASRGSVITPDGRYVAFVSTATNLVSADTNKIPDVFVRDVQSATTTLASVGARSNSVPPVAGTAIGSESPEITPDGRYVVFYSTATNLVPGVKTTGEIYVRDLVAGNTIWASTNARTIFKAVTGGTNIVNCNYSISDDGQFIAFEACTNTTMPASTRGIILRYNSQTGSTEIIHSNASVQSFPYELIHNLAMTPDGRFVAFAGNGAATNSIYYWDAQTGTNTLVSVSLDDGGPANGICDAPVISADGRVIAFVSSSTNLVASSLTGDYHVYLRDLPAGVTQLIDADSNGAGVGVDPAVVPAMSADGNLVAFECANLLADNRHRVHDVMLRDVATQTTSVISANDPDLQSLTPNGISGITPFSVSSKAQFVAFYSDADNLVADDTNGFRDVFVRDLVAGTNLLVSVSTNADASGDGISTDPAISGDGRYVAFTSSADNLVAGDTNRVPDVFIRDLHADTNALVSVSTNGIDPGNFESFSPVVSVDGRHVLFHSKASNLATGSFGSGVENLFFRDLQTGTTYPLTTSGVRSAAMTPDGQSIAFIGGAAGISGTQLYVWNSQLNALTYTNTSGGISFNSSFVLAAISPNGQKIAFVTGSTPYLYVVDLTANTVGQISSNGTFLSHTGIRFSSDARYLVYAVSSLNSAVQNVYLYDLTAGTNVLVSQNSNGMGAASAGSDSPAISPDGRFISYRSFATNIVPSDFNNAADLFVYDSSNHATILVSVNAHGDASSADRSLNPVFSADGRKLFFQSWAPDITGNDYNDGSDIFVLDLTALPLTTANGSGATNAESGFAAQLIPANVSGSVPVIVWPLAAGKSYQVQYKTNLTDAAWLNLPGDAAFIGTTGYLNDLLPSPGQRFYLIVLSP